MRSLKIIAASLGILTLLIIGCSEHQNPLDSRDSTHFTPQNLPLISLPPGAELNSATFSIYVEDFLGTDTHTINVHRITSSWDEATVTYNNFGGAYDPSVIASFTASGTGWYSCDITSLVRDWLDGTYPDCGLLIDQLEDNYTRYASSEYPNGDLHPKLEICFTIGGANECVTIQRGTNGSVADAVIAATIPNSPTGDVEELFTSNLSGLEKQSLLQFDVTVFVEPAAIGDTVWIDENQNGIQDDGEPGFPDVTVNLYDCDDNFIAGTTTDANGFYMFDNLIPGSYYVEFVQPEGYDITLQDQGGDDAIDSDADPVTGKTVCTTLAPAEYDQTWDCGLYLVPPQGCTLTIGFWKNHAGFGPQDNVVSQYLPIWLGDMGGSESINVADSAIAHDILLRNVYGRNSNGITKLYAQLLAAKLNIAAGADDSEVAGFITLADAFLADHYYTDWDSLNRATKKLVLGWMSEFDDYNNGYIGPGHCE